MSYEQMDPQRSYEEFASDTDPETLLSTGRDPLVNRLMTEYDMTQETAYYTADQILAHAEFLQNDAAPGPKTPV